MVDRLKEKWKEIAIHRRAAGRIDREKNQQTFNNTDTLRHSYERYKSSPWPNDTHTYIHTNIYSHIYTDVHPLVVACLCLSMAKIPIPTNRLYVHVGHGQTKRIKRHHQGYEGV